MEREACLKEANGNFEHTSFKYGVNFDDVVALFCCIKNILTHRHSYN